jgi:hypothetical protein
MVRHSGIVAATSIGQGKGSFKKRAQGHKGRRIKGDPLLKGKVGLLNVGLNSDPYRRYILERDKSVFKEYTFYNSK